MSFYCTARRSPHCAGSWGDSALRPLPGGPCHACRAAATPSVGAETAVELGGQALESAAVSAGVPGAAVDAFSLASLWRQVRGAARARVGRRR